MSIQVSINIHSDISGEYQGDEENNVESMSVESAEELSGLVDDIKQQNPNSAFSITFEKNLPLGNRNTCLDFNENGVLINNDRNGSDGAVIADAFMFHAILKRLSLDTDLPPSFKRVTSVLGYTFGMGAALKVFVGVKGAVESWLGWNGPTAGIIEKVLVNLLAVFAAVPPAIFYADNVKNLSRALIKQVLLNEVENNCTEEEKRIVLPSLLKQAFPEIQLSDSKIQLLLDFILGAGYAAANLGMVLAALDEGHNIGVDVLEDIALFLLGATNFAVGMRKVRKVTDDIKHTAKRLIWGEEENQYEKMQVRLMIHALKTHRKMVCKTYGHESLSADCQQLANQLRSGSSSNGDDDGDDSVLNSEQELERVFETLKDCDSINAMRHKLEEEVKILQAVIDAKLKLKVEDTGLLIDQLENNDMGHALEVYEYTEILVSNNVDTGDQEQQFLKKTKNAQGRPFYYQRSFTDEWWKLDWFLSFLSNAVCLLSATSNIGGVSYLLSKYFLGESVYSWLFGFVGSLPVIGLNKYYTDGLKRKVIELFAEKLLIEIAAKNEDFDHESTSWGVAECLGVLWANVGSYANGFYTWEAYKRFQEYSTYISSSVYSWLQLSSSAITVGTVTASKGDPTASWLGSFFKPKKEAEVIILNEELTAYQDEQIRIMMDGLAGMMEDYNKLREKTLKSQRGGLGLKTPLNIEQGAKSFNDEFKALLGEKAAESGEAGAAAHDQLERAACCARKEIVEALEALALQFNVEYYRAAYFGITADLTENEFRQISSSPVRHCSPSSFFADSVTPVDSFSSGSMKKTF